MSWLARSIASTLKLDDDSANTKDDSSVADNPIITDNDSESPLSIPQPISPNANGSHTTRGVKDDISEITKSLSRQFWGVASFLAPPPEHNSRDAAEKEEDLDLMKGIKSDFEEIGGKFKSGFSKFSSNIGVSEISKMASSFLDFGSSDQEVVGITEDVVVFARNLAMHPETWMDFPIPEDNSFEELEMSDTQQEHALAVEALVPSLASLRIELCPEHMSESCFWSIYFVLLHPRLSKEDAILLSSPNIFEARASLSHDLKKKPAANLDSKQDSDAGNQTVDIESEDTETEKHLVQSDAEVVVDKKMIEEEQTSIPAISSSKPSPAPVDDSFDDDVDADNWLKEEIAEGNVDGMTLENDEDVSFSDLEEDDGDEDAKKA